MNDLYQIIVIDKCEDIKDTYNRIQISQTDLDNYINFYKSHIHLSDEDANKLIIRYHEDLKTHTFKLYELIKNVKENPPEKTDIILNKLSTFLNDIEKDMKKWEHKS